MNQETPEDRTILAALDAPDGGISVSTPGPKTARDETAETLARLYTEVLGLLPYELEPQAPRPAVKQRLLAALAAAPPAETAPETVAVAAPPPVEQQPPAPAPLPAAAVPERRPSGEVRMPRPVSASVAAPYPPPPPPAPRRWPVALAASLALILTGFAGVLGYLVNEQRARLDNLEAELSKARAGEERARHAEAKAERAQAAMLRIRESLALVTAPSVSVMPLRPLGDSSPQPEAKGVLFVAADHQHWHLSLHRLRPAGPHEVYQLWFVTEEGRVVSGGTFTAREQAVSLSSPTMPDGTVAANTLEPAEGSASPTGPVLSKTDEAFQLS